jgi:hypothetical protein
MHEAPRSLLAARRRLRPGSRTRFGTDELRREGPRRAQPGSGRRERRRHSRPAHRGRQLRAGTDQQPVRPGADRHAGQSGRERDRPLSVRRDDLTGAGSAPDLHPGAQLPGREGKLRPDRRRRVQVAYAGRQDDPHVRVGDLRRHPFWARRRTGWWQFSTTSMATARRTRYSRSCRWGRLPLQQRTTETRKTRKRHITKRTISCCFRVFFRASVVHSCSH